VLLDKLKEELKRWEELTESLLQSIPLALFTADGEGKIVFVNKQVTEVFGIAKQQLLGRSIFNFPNQGRLLPFLDEREERKMVDSIRKLVVTGKQQETGVKVYHKSGRIVDLNVKFVQLRNNRGLATGFAFFAEDITDKKKLQHLLIQSEKLGGLGQLSASIVHQLKNSQGIINTSLYFLNDILPNKSSEMAKHFRIMQEELARSKRIVDNLLAYSRKVGVEKEEVNLNMLLKSTLSILDKEISARGISLTTDYGGNIPSMMANFEELKEAFLNLVINGIESMPSGGELEISTKWRPKDARVEVGIRDSGIGISEEHMELVFSPFFTTKRAGDGTGLGLTLVRSIIVDGHKGNVRVESEKGKGTVFTVELPLNQDENGPT